eukprot:5167527-Amphidinium_carterae.2
MPTSTATCTVSMFLPFSDILSHCCLDSLTDRSVAAGKGACVDETAPRLALAPAHRPAVLSTVAGGSAPRLCAA